MLKKNNKGEYIIDSLEKLTEWYKITSENDKTQKPQPKPPKKDPPKDKK